MLISTGKKKFLTNSFKIRSGKIFLGLLILLSFSFSRAEQSYTVISGGYPNYYNYVPVPTHPHLPTNLNHNVSIDLHIPPALRIGNTPYMQVRAYPPSYIYVFEIDSNKDLVQLPGPSMNDGYTYSVYGEGFQVYPPIGTNGINVVASRVPLPQHIITQLKSPYSYVMGFNHYVLSPDIINQLSFYSGGFGYAFSGYQVLP